MDRIHKPISGTGWFSVFVEDHAHILARNAKLFGQHCLGDFMVMHQTHQIARPFFGKHFFNSIP
jgi:hypothetical protein